MNRELNIFLCPETKARLDLIADGGEGAEVATGRLVRGDGVEYPIRDGIPDLIFPRNLAGEQKEARDYYEGVADVYDDVAHLSFRIQFVDETEARQGFVDLLRLSPDAQVLELACGTGRDSELIAAQLGANGRLYLQDISRSMLMRTKEKLAGAAVPVEAVVGNAVHLPFPDNHFDAVFSFGGLGVFGDIKASLAEIVRVAKVGARVVVGDESMPPWLYETEYGRILLANNPLFRAPIPFENIPVEARDVAVRWVVGGVYYLIEFTVGDGEPKADFDFPIPGRRGGTLRTRYYGGLEGVTPDTLALAQQARDASGKSMHDWLEEAVHAAAERDLAAAERK